METYIDFNILKDFFKTQPQQAPVGSKEARTYWNSFWDFLNDETDLFIIDQEDYLKQNCNEIEDRFFKTLISGRSSETHLEIIPRIKEHKCEIKVKNPYSFFCLNVNDELERQKYLRNNGKLIGFTHDYPNSWKRLSLKLLANYKISVRRKVPKNGFQSWEQLNPYLTPFTDLVISDSYILSNPNADKYNLESLLIIFDKHTPISYNLTLFTFEGNDPRKEKITITYVSQLLRDIKIRNNLKYKESIVVYPKDIQYIKEHDRNIFTNYLRITSGHSFNFLDENKELVKETELTFLSMANPIEYEAAKVVLESLKDSVNRLRLEKRDQRIYGEIQKNKLLYPSSMNDDR